MQIWHGITHVWEGKVDVRFLHIIKCCTFTFHLWWKPIFWFTTRLQNKQIYSSPHRHLAAAHNSDCFWDNKHRPHPKRNNIHLQALHKFCKPGIKLSNFKKNISGLSIYSSYHIWLCRNDPSSRSPLSSRHPSPITSKSSSRPLVATWLLPAMSLVQAHTWEASYLGGRHMSLVYLLVYLYKK